MVAVIHLESANVRKPEFNMFSGFVKMRCIPCCHQVAGHANMRSGIGAVGGQTDFQDGIAYNFKELRCGLAHFCFSRQNHDSVMGISQANFIFGTNHAFGNFTPDLALFNGEGVFAHGKRGAFHGHQHFLAFSHIGSAANNVKQFFAANIYFRQAKFVGVWMFCAGFYLSDHNAFQPATDVFPGFNAFNLKAAIGEDYCNFFRRRFNACVFFELITRYFHLLSV